MRSVPLGGEEELYAPIVKKQGIHQSIAFATQIQIN
jgi:hypothetical protein